MTSQPVMTIEEFVEKVDWEDGVLGALEYGLTEDNIPDGHDELKSLWRNAMSLNNDLYGLVDRINRILHPKPARNEEQE